MSNISTILHPTDLSESSMAAFRMACRLARAGTRIVVLHVMEHPLVSRGEYLETLNRRLGELEPPDPAIVVEIRLIEGHAADEILRAADDLGCDLIVMGSHGRARLAERLIGGVADAVLRRSRCQVLVVRSPATVPAAPADAPREGPHRHVIVF